jgi:hypothetical protein
MSRHRKKASNELVVVGRMSEALSAVCCCGALQILSRNFF